MCLLSQWFSEVRLKIIFIFYFQLFKILVFFFFFLSLFLPGSSGNLGFVDGALWFGGKPWSFSSEHTQDNVTYTSGPGTAMEGRCPKMGRLRAI